jgi:hypothetical protein
MPRGRPRRQPSGRNLELYHELVCESRLQVEVAERFRVSQPRVAQVRQEVADWVDSQLPAAAVADVNDAGSVVNTAADDAGSVVNEAGRRLHLAIALRRLQLTNAYGKYLEHFGGVCGAEGYGHLLAASDAGILPPTAAASLPRRELVESAVQMARELTELAEVAQRGQFFQLPELLREKGRAVATEQLGVCQTLNAAARI